MFTQKVFLTPIDWLFLRIDNNPNLCVYLTPVFNGTNRTRTVMVNVDVAVSFTVALGTNPITLLFSCVSVGSICSIR